MAPSGLEDGEQDVEMVGEQDAQGSGAHVEPQDLGAPGGDAETPEATDPATSPVAYEIVYECRDKMLGARLAQRLEEVVSPTWELRRAEEGPAWALVIEFPSPGSADVFFDSEFYRQFCIEARRSCRSSVLVVPLGRV